MAAKKKTAPQSVRKKQVKPAAPKRSAKKESAASKASGAGRSKGWAAKYAQTFGPAFPKGKVLNASGEYIPLTAAAQEEMCLVQFEPRPNRMGWVYVSQGFSQAACQDVQGQRVEIILHWKERDQKVPGKLLSEFAQYLRQSGKTLTPGEVVSSSSEMQLSVSGFRHWLVCPPDKNMPECIDADGNKIRFITLLGISDDEQQCASKVNADLADGRKVLFQALKAGGVFPLNDPGRPCMTRRRDFQRLWENSFRLVRDQRV